MNTLQINFSDYAGGGGAAIAMHTLHRELKNRNINSKILCGHKTLPSEESIDIPSKFNRLERITQKLSSSFGLSDIFRINSFSIKNLEVFQNSDILNFHTIHSGYFNYLALPNITAMKPAVCTLHDMWNFTGRCAYSYDCQRWQTGCGKCPHLDVYPATKRDASILEWKLKNWVYRRSNLVFVAPSRWLYDLAKQSMLNCYPIHLIPNGIDIKAYQPIEKSFCRKALDLPTDKFILLFSAENIKDPRKGSDLLQIAIDSLPGEIKKRLILLTFGHGGRSDLNFSGIETRKLGYISSERLKCLAYSAANLFIFPTRADNLPLVLQESMACGTPMISFDVGGVRDLVRPNITGYLADQNNPRDLSHGIVQLLENSDLTQQMAKNCRQIALQEYSIELQASQYIALYNSILSNFQKTS